MKVHRIRIEWKPTSEEDTKILSGETKYVEFEDGKGWNTHGPIFPTDFKLISLICEWLKEHWNDRT